MIKSSSWKINEVYLPTMSQLLRSLFKSRRDGLILDILLSPISLFINLFPRSLYANRTVLGYEDEDSLERPPSVNSVCAPLEAPALSCSPLPPPLSPQSLMTEESKEAAEESHQSPPPSPPPPKPSGELPGLGLGWFWSSLVLVLVCSVRVNMVQCWFGLF